MTGLLSTIVDLKKSQIQTNSDPEKPELAVKQNKKIIASSSNSLFLLVISTRENLKDEDSSCSMMNSKFTSIGFLLSSLNGIGKAAELFYVNRCRAVEIQNQGLSQTYNS